MSDAVSAYPADRSQAPTGRTRQRPGGASSHGTMPDPALSVPLGHWQDPSYEEVLIGAKPALTDRQIESLLTAQFREAKAYDDRLQIARSMALRLYNGEPMGDEEPGRSQIILTEVKDSIQAAMPTMMRVFAGADHPVEFLPRADGDDAEAQQAQDYVQHVCFVENDGWRAIHDAILDAFQLKVGWVKWWWDYTIDVKTETYTGLLESQAGTLINEPGVTAMRVVRRQASPAERAGILASPEAQVTPIQPGMPLLVYDCQITRKASRNRPRVVAVPSENILIDPDASGPQDPGLRFIGHWRIVTVSDLVALGFDKDLVESRITQLRQSQNLVTRRRDRLAALVPRGGSADPAMRRVRYLECWMRFDLDGDGIAELHHLHAIGDYGFLLLGHECCAHVPLARVCPFMVSHKAVGESFADRVGDLQRAMTRVFRNILDSMSESIHPRTVVEEGMANTDDVLNTEMGAVIRVKKQGAVTELVKPFVGPAALPLMEALGVIKEGRTGITRTSQGLTADVLQSTTAIAVSAQLSSSADRLELIVRTVAEGIRDTYEGVLRLMCEHQDRPRTVLLRGRWTPVDPRAWMSSFNVVVKVGVGHGTLAERMQVLAAILAQQKQAVETMGPNNPICTLGQIRNTIADMANAAGIMNVARYFNPLPTNYQYQPPPQPPSPDQIIAQAEATKATSGAATDQQKAQTDRLKAVMEDDRLRDEGRMKAVLEALDLQGKYGMNISLPSLAGLFDRAPDSPARQLAMPAAGAVPGGPPMPGVPQPPGMPPGPGLQPPGGAPAPSPLPGGAGAPPGLAQRLFLPPPLISALASANRAPTPPMMPTGPAPGPPPSSARPGAMTGFSI